MSHDGLEVFDADHDVQLLLGVKLFEICSIDGYCGLQRILEDLYHRILVGFIDHVRILTILAIHDLVSEAKKCDLAVLKVDVELLRLGPEILGEFFEKECSSGPMIVRGVSIKQCMHDFSRLVR
jgi:hypothetical protein